MVAAPPPIPSLDPVAALMGTRPTQPMQGPITSGPRGTRTSGATYASGNDLPPCQSGIWSRPDTPGQYAFFNASSCPAGWVAANGTNGTVDLRGEFVRGWDSGRGVDSGRLVAAWQADAFGSHNHNMNFAGGGGFGVLNPGHDVGADTWNTTVYQTRSTTSTGGSETRPRNVALLACVKL